MERYLLFCCRHYYPSGGIDDLVGVYSSLKECEAGLIDYLMLGYEYSNDTKEQYLEYEKSNNAWHVYDIVDKKKIELNLQSSK